MKTNLLKYYIAAFYFCSTFVMLAQPSQEAEGESLQGEEPAAPIDDYLWVLAAIGLIYVFYRVRSLAHQESVPKQ